MYGSGFGVKLKVGPVIIVLKPKFMLRVGVNRLRAGTGLARRFTCSFRGLSN